ncbi:MAG: acyltransferase [Cytophagaceae bacterium]|jgi:peptidoglycan/LPS O-acetylase OafA/YrhL|nr:acyltransferase [Cytophagaceae bacterium]
MEESKRNNLGIVRFILALVVFVAHFLELGQITDLAFLRPWAKSFLAVQLFFMLSGYFSVSSFEKSKGTTAFYMKRFFRIYPAYFFVVFISFLLLSLISTLDLTSYFSSSATWKYLGANLLFANFLAPVLPGVFDHNHLPYINGSLWTLKIEVAYFLFVPVIFFARKHIGKWPVSVGLIVISLLYAFLLEKVFLGHGIWIKQLPGQLHWFAFGLMAFDLRDKIFRINSWVYFAALIALCVLHYWWTPLLFVIAIALVFGIGLKLPSYKISNWMGNVSYSFYLIHFPVIQVGVALGLIVNNNGLSFLGCLIVILALSSFIYRCVERPLMIKKQ